jgi:transposase-like protein
MEVVETMTISGRDHEDLRATTGRGRFAPNDVLAVFNVNFMDYDFARLWILKRLHPDGAHCPGCGLPVADKSLQRFWSNGRLSCRECGKYFTALTGTFLAGCHLDYRGVILLAVLLTLGVHDKQIAAIVGTSAENVRLWRIKFNVQARLASKEGS